MESRKRQLDAAIFTLICSVTGCGSEPGTSEPGPSEPAEHGGMDGAGGTAIGLSWKRDLFIQQAWLNGRPQFTVYNRRNAPVAIEVRRLGEESKAALETWRVPPSGVSTFSGADVDELLNEGALDGFFTFVADGQALGLVDPTRVPLTGSSLDWVSNRGLNWDGEDTVQVETAFAAATPREFTLTLAVPFAGTLTLHPTSPAVEGLPFIDIVRVHTSRFADENDAGVEDAGEASGTTIPLTSSRFIVDATRATPERPLLVDVDVAVPSDFAGPFIGFSAWYCSVPVDSADDDCDNGGGITRGFAVGDEP